MAQPLQQDDNFKEFMSWITSGGLRYACAKQQGADDADLLFTQKVNTAKSYRVVVVGAGLAGLSAAYELAQIGHKVTILEMQSRVGGRVKTFREGFADGLHCEGGAMRIPQNHYLTRHYVDQFGIVTRKFQNYQQNSYMYLFGNKIRMKEFAENNGTYSDRFWSGWDANLTDDVKRNLGIDSILSYYGQTFAPVKAELGDNPTEQDWQAWITKWSVLSVEDFLRGTKYQAPGDPQLRPWPEAAINGLLSFSADFSLGVDVSWMMRDDLGQWVARNMYTPTDGMDALPKAFIQPNTTGWNSDVDLSGNIVYGCRVDKVELSDVNPDLAMNMVTITGFNTATGATQVYNADAVIITVPLPIMRQMDLPLHLEQSKALAHVTYAHATKVMLQCRTRFWQKDVGQGGFSQTNMLIGQIFYPDHDESGIADTERGVLLIYNWFDSALTFASQTDEQIIKECIQEVSKIHPEIEQQFEVGQVQSWSKDPSAQAAFSAMKPYEYMTSMKRLKRPVPPIYLAGEAISWSNGWIQGALYSGLLQAFLFQARAEGYGDIDPFTMLDNIDTN